MKHRFAVCFCLTLVSLATFAVSSLASTNEMDPLTVGGKMYRLLFENERVRVMEVTFQPGEKIGMHSHPDHVVHILDGGKLKIETGDGTVSELEMKTGETMWLPAQSHKAENLGQTKVRILVTELKEPAPAAAKGQAGEHKH
jgi:quercetin dioxygenase-like cupin family protein